MDRVYFKDYDDMEKQVLNLLLTDEVPTHEWVREMLRVFDEELETARSRAYGEGHEDGYSEGYADVWS